MHYERIYNVKGLQLIELFSDVFKKINKFKINKISLMKNFSIKNLKTHIFSNLDN